MLTTQVESGILPDVTNWLSVTEAAKESGYSAFYVRKLCRLGTLEAVKKGQMYLINPESLRAYVRKMKSLGTAKHDWRHKED